MEKVNIAHVGGLFSAGLVLLCVMVIYFCAYQVRSILNHQRFRAHLGGEVPGTGIEWALVSAIFWMVTGLCSLSLLVAVLQVCVALFVPGNPPLFSYVISGLAGIGAFVAGFFSAESKHRELMWQYEGLSRRVTAEVNRTRLQSSTAAE